MLNEVLEIVMEKQIIKLEEKEKFRDFALELLELGRHYDCNDGEILDGIGEKIGLCYCCLEATEDIEDGICKKCRD
jgi:hypothetical protein